MIEVLYTESDIRERIELLGKELTAFYKGRPLTVVALLNGGLIFAADLLRKLDLPLQFDTFAAASYCHDKSSGELKIRSRLKLDVAGRDVLLIDDILDSGFTMKETVEYFNSLGASRIRVCVLLDKILEEGKPKFMCCPDWHGFRVPDYYVVGYGLDSEEKYRNLPYIGRIVS